MKGIRDDQLIGCLWNKKIGNDVPVIEQKGEDICPTEPIGNGIGKPTKVYGSEQLAPREMLDRK